MYLYLDDWRDPRHKGFHVVRTYEDCIDALSNNKVIFLSLDHDLSIDEYYDKDEKTGYDVAKFLVKKGMKIPNINIHSANPIGRNNIKQLIEHYFPDTTVTCIMKI